MTRDLYLQDLGHAADAPLGVYQQWRKDPQEVARVVLAADGLDDLAAAPENVRRDVHFLLDEAERLRDRARQELAPDHAERVHIGAVPDYGLVDPSSPTWSSGTVQRIETLFWDAPVLTRGLLAEAMAAFNANNRPLYCHAMYVTAADVADLWWQPRVRRIRRGSHRMVVRRSRGIERARPVRQWLTERLGHRIYPLTA